MFDEKTVAAWQSITPPDGLKEKVLNQKPASVTPFPRRWQKVLPALAAACAAILLLVLVQPVPMPGVRPSGDTVYAVAAVQTLQRDLSASGAVMLEPDGLCRISVQDGELLSDGGAVSALWSREPVLWRVSGPGPHSVTFHRGLRSAEFTLTQDAESGVWQLSSADDQ